MVSSATGTRQAEIGTTESRNNENTHQRKNDPGLNEACNLVQAIFEQVTLGDSPPINEEGAFGDVWLIGKCGDANDITMPMSGVNFGNDKFFQTNTNNHRTNPILPCTNSDASTFSNSTASAQFSYNGVTTHKPSSGGAAPIAGPRQGFSRQRHVLPVYPEYCTAPTPSSVHGQVGSPGTGTGSGTVRNTVSTTSLSPMSTLPSVQPAQSIDSLGNELLPEGNPSAGLSEEPAVPQTSATPRADASRPFSPETVGDESFMSEDQDSLQIMNSLSSEQYLSSDQTGLTPDICSSIIVDVAECQGTNVEIPASMSAASVLQPPPQISRPHLSMPQYRTKSEMTMGNMALASLCARTLDSVASTAALTASAPVPTDSAPVDTRKDGTNGYDEQKNAEELSESEEEGQEEKGRLSLLNRRKLRSEKKETASSPKHDIDQTPKRQGSSWISRNVRNPKPASKGLRFSPKKAHKEEKSDDEDDEMPSYQRLSDSDHGTDSELDANPDWDEKACKREGERSAQGIKVQEAVQFDIASLSNAGISHTSTEDSNKGSDKYSKGFHPQRTFDSEINSLNTGWDELSGEGNAVIAKPNSERPKEQYIQKRNSLAQTGSAGVVSKVSTIVQCISDTKDLIEDNVHDVSQPDNDGGLIALAKDSNNGVKEVMKTVTSLADKQNFPDKSTDEAVDEDAAIKVDDNLLLSSSNEDDIADMNGIKNDASEEIDPAPPSDCSVSSASSESSSSSKSSTESAPLSTSKMPPPDGSSSPTRALLGSKSSSPIFVEVPDSTQTPLLVKRPVSPPPQIISSYLRKNQMQMFGSEYARFLSSTPFSPNVRKPAKTRKKKLLSKLSRTSQSQKGDSGSGTVLSGPSAHTPVHGIAAMSSNPNPTPKEGGPPNLEDASDAILTGAITDVLVTHGSEKPPRGYYRISQTGDGTNMNLLKRANASGASSMVPGRKQTTVYLNVKKEPNWDRAVQRPCVTALAIIFPDRNEFVPPGFCVVRRYKSRSSQGTQGSSSSKDIGKGKHKSATDKNRRDGLTPPTERNSEGSTTPANLNFGTLGERVYLCYRRSREGNPITGIIPLQPHKGEAIPEGYTVLERTPRNYVADVNCKAGTPLFLAFRQRLANLEPLRPLPLVLSVFYSNPEEESDPEGCSRNAKNKYLCAYYCTGGTVVPSHVGRFHIMDRSTHPLLSPSSVTNRLSLIQASRRQRAAASGNSPTPGISSTSTISSVQSRESRSVYTNPLTSPPSSVVGSRKKKNKLPGVMKPSRSPKDLIGRNRRDAKFPVSSNSDSITNSPKKTIGADTEIALHHNDIESVVSSSSSDLLGHKSQQQSLQKGGKGEVKIREPFEICDPDIDSPNERERLHQGSMDSDAFEADESAADSTSMAGSSLSSPHPIPLSTPTPQKGRHFNRRGIFCHEDSTLQSCFDAMDFIPLVEDAYIESENNPSSTREDQMDTHLMLLQARVAVLTPILTSCYTHHGGSALLAVEGLTKLLNTTDFFLTDVVPDDREYGTGGLEGSSGRLTLLDLSLQVVCDVATSTSRETTFFSCVEFVSDAVRYAKCRLNTRTIGYVLRFYLFVFYFGASVPTASSWPNTMKGTKYSQRASGGEFVDTALLNEGEKDGKGRRKYLPGGAPQIAALALKELVTLIVEKMKTFKSDDDSFRDIMATAAFSGCEVSDFMRGLLSNIIDGAMHRVEVANYTQLALHQIHRSGGSELFWHDMMTSCGIGLFGHDPSLNLDAKNGYVVTFAVLASLVKVSSGKVRRVAQTTDLVPRDVASKLLSLELLLHFLQQWRTTFLKDSKHCSRMGGKEAKSTLSDDTSEMSVPETRNNDDRSASVSTMVYTIRRLVVPCLLSNTASGLEDSRVFRRMIRIVSELWCTSYYRKHMKMELGVLIEHFILKVLRLGPMVLPPKRLRELEGKLGRGGSNAPPSSLLDDITSPLLSQQIDVLTEVRRCFATKESSVLELFINYDTEQSSIGNTGRARMLPGTQWKITEQLCGALCTLAEQCGDMISDQIRVSSHGGSTVGVRGGVSAGAALSSAIVAPHATPLHHTMTSARSEDITEITRVREGARVLQEKSYDAIGIMIKSFMRSAVQASGRCWKQFLLGSPLLLSVSPYKKSPRGGGQSIASIDFDAEVVSDISLKDGSKKSWSNWKHGLRRNEAASSGSTENGAPSSPRRHLPPSKTTSPTVSIGNGDGNIVEYWQTSIATERRKVSASSPGPEDRRKTNSSPEKIRPANDAGSPMAQLSRANNGWGNRFSRPRSTAKWNPTMPNYQTRIGQTQNSAGVGLSATSLDRTSPFHQKTEDTLNVAFEIMSNKNLKKALDYLIACNYLTPSPRDVASFLRLHQAQLDQVALGEYLGEGGKDGADVEYWNLIRFNYVRAISFVGMNVEQGLRHFLTNSGFRLPGEAQKIDRIISTFSQCYWEDNAGDHLRCPFHDQDTVFLISFAIIMLNTDLHKSNSSLSGTNANSGRKQRKKMTKTEFMNNLRGVDNSEDLSRDYLSAIYDSIEAQPIALFHEHDEWSGSVKSGSSKYSSSTSKSRMSVALREDPNDLTTILKSMIRSVKPAQELLRGLAVHEHPFLSVSDYDEDHGERMLKGIVRTAISVTWHHFHGTINATLDTAHLDPNGLVLCLDVLRYALCTTICLDMPMERTAFVTQLARIKLFKENRSLDENVSGSSSVSSAYHDHQAFKNETWYKNLEGSCSEPSNERGKLSALDQVNTMIKDLHSSLEFNQDQKEDMKRVASCIRNGEVFLNDPARTFIREGDLVKRSNHVGRSNNYRFFLFSDMLVYAHRSSSIKRDYKIHGELPLHLMKVIDDENGGGKKHMKSFFIQHPQKSFLLHAPSPELKKSWVTDITSAIKNELERKARVEGARLASISVDR